MALIIATQMPPLWGNLGLWTLRLLHKCRPAGETWVFGLYGCYTNAAPLGLGLFFQHLSINISSLRDSRKVLQSAGLSVKSSAVANRTYRGWRLTIYATRNPPVTENTRSVPTTFNRIPVLYYIQPSSIINVSGDSISSRGR